MSQVDNTFTAYFITATAPGTPITGLSATITIVEAATGTVAINNVAMTEVGLGWYKYTFSAMDSNKDYLYSCNPNSASAFIESGVTDKRINNLDRELTSIVGGGRGMSVNMTGVTSSINRMSKELTTKIEEDITKLSDLIKLVNNENYSHIDVVKTDIIDKIDSIEIPETIIEEKEAKKAIKLIQNVDKKLTTYIDSEDSEKEELRAITREFTKLEMEEYEKHRKHMEEMKMKEEEDKKKEEEEDKMILEEIKKEFDKQDEMEKEEKRKEIEKELEELEKERKEKEKELNSL